MRCVSLAMLSARRIFENPQAANENQDGPVQTSATTENSISTENTVFTNDTGLSL